MPFPYKNKVFSGAISLPHCGRDWPFFLKGLFGTLLFLSLIASINGAVAQEMKRDVEASHQWYSLGKYNFQFRKDFKKSREALLMALEKDPQNFLAFEMLQEVERRLRREEMVSGSEGKSDIQTPQGGESMQWYDNALYHWEKSRDARESIRCLERALQINPFNTRAIALLRTIRKENPEYSAEKALPGVKIQADPAGRYETIAKTQEAQHWFANSTYHFRKGNLARAMEAIEKSLSLAPDLKVSTELKNKISQALSKREKLAIESSLERTAASLEGKTPEGGKASHWFWLGKYYFSVKRDYKGALECFERAALMDPNHDETQSMINRTKLKLYFVTDGSAVRIVDTRSDKPISTGLDSASENAVGRKIGDSQTEKKREIDPAAVEAEEIELVGDYEFADTTRTAPDRGDVVGDLQEKAKKSPYELWMARRKAFEDMGGILFAGQWKREERAARKAETVRTSTGQDRKGDVESELEAMWNNIQKGEIQSSSEVSGTDGNGASVKSGVAAIGSDVAQAMAGFDIGGMKREDEYKAARQKQRDSLMKPDEEVKLIPPDMKQQIMDTIASAEEMAKRGRTEDALKNYESAFLSLIKYDPDNLEALYNLLLVNIRQEDDDFATLLLFRLLGMMDKIGSNSELHKAVREIVFCFVKSTILQSSISAYNNSVEPLEKMTTGTLSLERLSASGLLVTGDVPYELSLKIGERTVKAAISMDNFKCSAGGKYHIGRDGFVRCTVHGMSPYLRMRGRAKKWQ
ncbi:MAG: hypothetical protein CVV64_09550 [Candidatus Wallbacteria bacterium HGW-Wallbacteria-1]|jgi:tetratricopeptide (TPR) repeat protein|uniref:Tetratricopeptide repeat protein n=1 Tax=Candidatus Wallbacteria bacterium HGW-Wallbacteria-1 TaxID=2013854 RepID=A0A2N1PQH3_9BACT|nr:MAG: hypothetical protein CVV64_09550 [Candidatus Wallbacteria bacterium HGW-Wallbacteria-1]